MTTTTEAADGGLMYASVAELRQWHRPVARGVCAGPASVATCQCRGAVYAYSCGHVTNHCPWMFYGNTDVPVPGQRPEWDCPACKVGKLPTPASSTATCENRKG